MTTRIICPNCREHTLETEIISLCDNLELGICPKCEYTIIVELTLLPKEPGHACNAGDESADERELTSSLTKWLSQNKF